MQPAQSIVVDPISPGGVNSPHGLILFDGVCVLCSRACSFVSKRDRSGYFRFVPIQLAEGRPLAEQLGIDPQRPDSFAFVAKGRAYIKSEAALRIASELPYWRWTWVFHFIPQVIRDEVYDLVARNRYRWFGRREACVLPNSDRSWPVNRPENAGVNKDAAYRYGASSEMFFAIARSQRSPFASRRSLS